MATVTELEADIALSLHDVANAELTTPQLLLMINRAVRWLRNAGVLVPIEEDETLTEASSTYSFNVPANFAYISKLIRENTSTGTYDGYNTFPHESWRLGTDGGNPVIIFDEARYISASGANIKIIGQKRPALYTTGNDTVDSGLENLLTERALYYSFQYLAAGRSEYAGWRQQEAMLARDESERALMRAPQQFRMKPNSRWVPGR